MQLQSSRWLARQLKRNSRSFTTTRQVPGGHKLGFVCRMSCTTYEVGKSATCSAVYICAQNETPSALPPWVAHQPFKLHKELSTEAIAWSRTPEPLGVSEASSSVGPEPKKMTLQTLAS